MRYGRDNEPIARAAYQQMMRNSGHPELTTFCSGFVIDRTNPWLGCSPDDLVSDPDHECEPGVVEYKCPSSAASMTPEEAAVKLKNFCLQKSKTTDEVKLKQSHNYYYQVQGTMAITGRKWCDFVVWTPSKLYVERIRADQTLRNSTRTGLS